MKDHVAVGNPDSRLEELERSVADLQEELKRMSERAEATSRRPDGGETVAGQAPDAPARGRSRRET